MKHIDSGLRILILVIVAIVILYMVNLKSPTLSNSTVELTMAINDNERCGYLVQPDTNWIPYKGKVVVKGIYLSGSTVGNSERFFEIINFIDSTE